MHPPRRNAIAAFRILPVPILNDDMAKAHYLMFWLRGEVAAASASPLVLSCDPYHKGFLSIAKMISKRKPWNCLHVDR